MAMKNSNSLYFWQSPNYNLIEGITKFIDNLIYPWDVTISLVLKDHLTLHIWLPVSTLFYSKPLETFQNLRDLSVVPPPLHNILFYLGDHANALIAAVWSRNT